ncbi:MAG: galactose-1-phosphate uridylyltransferase, partial [Lachnospiraceae bacterium]|nr:galactose-1-phosphate uridylyltransferase [Lachnospiraceae bacterium]
MIDTYIAKLVQYGIDAGLIPEEERIYSTNQILEVLEKDDYEAPTETFTDIDLADTLAHILDYALETGVLKDGGVVSRDLFDTKLMNCITPRPSQVIHTFRENYAVSARHATDEYYKFSVATNYIRKDRIAKDRRWKVPSE